MHDIPSTNLQIKGGANRYNLGWIDVFMAEIIMLFYMFKVYGLFDSRVVIELF